MRRKGKITTWKDEQGFGFITPIGGRGQVFVHIKAFANRKRRPAVNAVVTYKLTTDHRGRSQAERVAFAEDRTPVSVWFSGGLFSLLLAGVFLVLVGVSVWTGKTPVAVLGLYAGASVLAFLAYGLDKSAARKGAWRTPENTLHIFALIGGWPGALVAQKVLRHKSRKRAFQVVYWATVIVNCGAFIWLHTPQGSSTLRSVLHMAV